MIEKILLLGSGAIRIGQAGEFDYSGSQAIKALKEEGIRTVLVNPNIATIQTSDHLADEVYFVPLKPKFVEKVIAREKPAGIMLGFGGQTALNVGLELEKKGVFKKHGVEILGTPLKSIEDTEDRDTFTQRIGELGLKVPTSQAVTSVKEASAVADEIGYPVMCRVAYALGGLGSGVAADKEGLRELTSKAFTFTPQVLIEKYYGGWKELEYEVVRDRYDNCIVVCSMENIDPMGIHTGESIVVAPVQTLTAEENFRLRSMAIRVIRHLGIVGECNIQFALDSASDDYRIIEVNARLSRSSALASKATGYPLAFIAAKLALGQSLVDVRNRVTKDTSACFEPALDYIVVKHPRWDLEKFKKVSLNIGSEMKSVGEVMSIARGFEEGLQKAIRMLDIGVDGLACSALDFDDLDAELTRPTDKRLFAIAQGFRQGYSVHKIQKMTKVDPWYLHKIKNIVDMEEELANGDLNTIDASLLRKAKRLGFSDRQIGTLADCGEMEVRERRKALDIVPCVKQIDTLAAEYPARTNYLYLTYNGTGDDLEFGDRGPVIVLGGGSYRIGSSVEFDWCCVNSVMSLKKAGHETIMINYNPETVSTDYDICDKLYFDELTLERTLDICDKESPKGIIVSMGGQIPNTLALPLHRAGVTILGTSPEDIDRAEDRHKFSSLLDDLGIDQPRWRELTSLEEAKGFAKEVGYPVLIRPSYVLSGAAMSIALNDGELTEYLRKASDINLDHPVVISKFITGAKEIELDAVAKDGELCYYVISEHVENAGVHSGDATLVLPPQRTYLETMRRIKVMGRVMAEGLNITGPFNIQFIAKDNEVKVIECNLRASRSFPFVSKVAKQNLVGLATMAIMGEELPRMEGSPFDLDYVGVKAPQFSFTRLKGSDPVLGVEMVSTGEVACLGDDFSEAFLKSLISVGYRVPEKGILLSTGPLESKVGLLKAVGILKEMGYTLYATGGTADFLKARGIGTKALKWPLEEGEPNTVTHIEKGKIDLVINIPKNFEKLELDNDYIIRRKAVDFNVPLITNQQIAKRFIEAIYGTSVKDAPVKSWKEYQ